MECVHPKEIRVFILNKFCCNRPSKLLSSSAPSIELIMLWCFYDKVALPYILAFPSRPSLMANGAIIIVGKGRAETIVPFASYFASIDRAFIHRPTQRNEYMWEFEEKSRSALFFRAYFYLPDFRYDDRAGGIPLQNTYSNLTRSYLQF